MTQGVDIEERSGGARGENIERLKYHCGTELVAHGSDNMEPLSCSQF